MTLQQAFTFAWKEAKSLSASVTSYFAANEATIKTVVDDVSKVAVLSGAPAATVTNLDHFEESLVGTVAAAAADVTKAQSMQDIFGDSLPHIQAIVATLKNHPTVQSVTETIKAQQQ
jgi:hypothetical protein